MKFGQNIDWTSILGAILTHITRVQKLAMIAKNFRYEELLSALKMRLPQKRAHQDDSNDTPHHKWVKPCQIIDICCGLG